MTRDAGIASKHRVVVVGAGFGGLSFIDGIAPGTAQITLIDKQNHHLFQPLLYQAATTVLPISDIAWPIRMLMRKRRDVRVVEGEVCGVDTSRKLVRTARGDTYPYDTLLLAPGSKPSYFGHEEWARAAPGLKTASDALALRTKILAAFEKREREGKGRAPVIAIIGGGPTGVELAGMIANLCSRDLARDFRTFDTAQTRIVIIDAADRILSSLPDNLAGYGEEKLRKMGVELKLGETVTGCHPDHVALKSGDFACDVTIWAAGTKAVPVAKWLGVDAGRDGRIDVEPDLSVPGQPDVFVIGDAAKVGWTDDKSVPGLAPAAKQEGAYVARVVSHRLRQGSDPGAFAYRHQGDLATIGRNAAVVRLGSMDFTGRIAWWLWGLAHIFFLITIRSRIAVLLHWFVLQFQARSDARLSFSDDDVASRSGPAASEESDNDEND